MFFQPIEFDVKSLVTHLIVSVMFRPGGLFHAVCFKHPQTKESKMSLCLDPYFVEYTSQLGAILLYSKCQPVLLPTKHMACFMGSETQGATTIHDI